MFSLLCLTLIFLGICLLLPPVVSQPPVSVKLDNGTFVGVSQGATNKFLGVPFAKPPCVHK